MASEGLKGRTVTLKLKTTNFEVRTRAATLTRHISTYEDIHREALRLLRLELPITIRLMVSLLSPASEHLPTLPHQDSLIRLEGRWICKVIKRLWSPQKTT